MQTPIVASNHWFIYSLRFCFALAVALAVMAVTNSVQAWPTLVCTAASNLGQGGPAIASNGIGGAYVVFRGVVEPGGGTRASAYGTHLTHSGMLFPPSAPCGDTLFLTSTFTEMSTDHLRAEPDGVGGAFVAAQQSRNQSNLRIFMQRVNTLGGRLWGLGLGVAVSTTNSFQAFSTTSSPAIAPDGAGGCYVIWQDNRFVATHDLEIYLQHVLSNGLIDSSWPADGLRLTTQTLHQLQPTVVSDGSGGVFAVWKDEGSGAGDIKALHVLADTTLAVGWSPNGNPVSSDPNNQERDPVAAPDGSGGVYISWSDGDNVYASRLLEDGSMPSGSWVAGGIAVASATGAQVNPSITVGPDQRAIITWMDLRQPSNGQDVFAQSIGLDGSATWPTNGVPVATVAGDQSLPRLVSTASSGVVITWNDNDLLPNAGSVQDASLCGLRVAA